LFLFLNDKTKFEKEEHDIKDSLLYIKKSTLNKINLNELFAGA